MKTNPQFDKLCDFNDEIVLVVQQVYHVAKALRDGKRDTDAREEGLSHLDTARDIALTVCADPKATHSSLLVDTVQALYDVFFEASKPPHHKGTAPTLPKAAEASTSGDRELPEGLTVFMATYSGLISAGIENDKAQDIAAQTTAAFAGQRRHTTTH